MPDPTPTPAAELRERIARCLWPVITGDFARSHADAILAEIERTHAIVPRSDMAALNPAAVEFASSVLTRMRHPERPSVTEIADLARRVQAALPSVHPAAPPVAQGGEG